MSYHIDPGSVNSLGHQLIFITLGYIGAAIGSVDIQMVSWCVAITVGVDTLLGSPIRGTMKRVWSKYIKW